MNLRAIMLVITHRVGVLFLCRCLDNRRWEVDNNMATASVYRVEFQHPMRAPG